MLVLSREVGEQVVLGDDIRVKVVAIHGNRVRLGLEAPAGVIIRREELIPPADELASPPKRGGRLDLP